MTKFYGQVEGMGNTVDSRRGSQNIKSSVQSCEGSIITELYTRYDQTLVDNYYLVKYLTTLPFSLLVQLLKSQVVASRLEKVVRFSGI